MFCRLVIDLVVMRRGIARRYRRHSVHTSTQIWVQAT